MDAGVGEARGFVAWLSRQGLSPRSINRMISGVRGWYRFLERRGEVSANPFAEIRRLRTEKRLPSFLFEEEAARAKQDQPALADSAAVSTASTEPSPAIVG